MADRLPSHCEHYQTGSYAPYVREHRLAGQVGDLLEVAQPPGDFSDPPTASLTVIRALSDGIHQRSDLGGGRFEARSRSGDLFIIAPGIATDILVHNDHVIRCFGIHDASLRPHLKAVRSAGDPFDFGPLHAGPFRNPFVLGLLDRLWADAERGHAASRLFAEGAALAIAAELLRAADPAPQTGVGGLAPWQVKRVTDYARERLGEDLALADLAATVDLSPYHFARAFKVSTGLPPHRYQMKLRAERAKELLAFTNRSVTEIAHACGFASSQHMATVFRRLVGTTPTAYRRERRS